MEETASRKDIFGVSCIDRFHLMKIFGDAVNNVRRQEAQQYSELKKTRWIWLKNVNKLTAKEKEQIEIIKINIQDQKMSGHGRPGLIFRNFTACPWKIKKYILKNAISRQRTAALNLFLWCRLQKAEPEGLGQTDIFKILFSLLLEN